MINNQNHKFLFKKTCIPYKKNIALVMIKTRPFKI